jgi:metal-dependent amidase/aminoacylase/carboxypeptidase family protein
MFLFCIVCSHEISPDVRYAHDLLSDYMSRHGFVVTKHYLGLATAWRAEYQHGKGGRVIGINSEMDALAGMGHACGHNLIAISGVGIAIAVKAAMEVSNIAGKVVLLGTPGNLTAIIRGTEPRFNVLPQPKRAVAGKSSSWSVEATKTWMLV